MIESIYIDGLRSIRGLEQEFGSGITVVYGPNGCGKTSLLEAIYLLSQGFSFRARDLKELIQWKSNELLLRGTFREESQECKRAIRVHRRGNDVRQDGESLKSPSGFFGNYPAVIMQPSDIELLRGAPEVRRHWLDEILCFRSAANAAVLRRYKRVLQQRNQWLRQFKKEGTAVGGEELFQVLTYQLVEQGAKLWAARLNLSREISPIITSYYRKLSGGVDEITCQYKSSILKELDAMDGAVFMDDEELGEASLDASPAIAADSCGSYSASPEAVDEETLRTAFARKLDGLAFVEKMQGMTMSGPHKDDLSLCIGGYEMRSVGSQGQCRSAAVAMRFAAFDVAERYLKKPVLLLDDIFAELDVNRRDAVASLIREKGCQVVIATPQIEDLPFTADAQICLK